MQSDAFTVEEIKKAVRRSLDDLFSPQLPGVAYNAIQRTLGNYDGAGNIQGFKDLKVEFEPARPLRQVDDWIRVRNR